MCLYPRIIINPKYKPNAKNMYNPPNLADCRVYYAPVGCGKCIECRKQKSMSWKIRLIEDIKEYRNGKFVTLTFDKKWLAYWGNKVDDLPNKIAENELAKLAVRDFLERWRKKYGKSVRHWLITELGHTGTERIHLHGIIYTDEIESIKSIWKFGYVFIGDYVNETTIGYIVKYVTKIDTDHKGFEPKILTSAGIGKNYLKRNDSKLNSYKGIDTKEYYTSREGLKLTLPRYYKSHLYNDDEKEMLWINKLNENKRFVLGTEIDISSSEDRYYKLLKTAQAKNKRLGFGDNTEDWDILRYKKDRAKLKYKK